jgi:CubicO group peptidase (beta-lactamase class C family)
MNYGYQTYQKQIPVSDSTLYDLASVTKVAGTLQILMMLVEHGYIDPDRKISFYLPELKKTNKEDLIIRDILSHQAGLISYHPYWINTINERNSGKEYYSSTLNREYKIEVIPGMYAKPNLKDSIWSWMIKSDLIEKEDSLKPYGYVYSDIGFYLIQRLIETVTGIPLNEFLDEYLYTPIGLKHISYLPKNKFPIKQIAPTEVDNTFRKGIIQGNVHDEIASIFGGIAGHAGLFSNAYSLAVLMQMNLQNGYYGGIQYINPRTLSDFTMRQYTFNRRGLGWDKPQIIGHEYNPASFHATMNSYGHSGFTGTFVWVDPGFDLVYIFLSNRTYPDIRNKKLIDSEVRKRIQTVIYSSIDNK